MKNTDGALRRVNFLSWEDILRRKKPAARHVSGHRCGRCPRTDRENRSSTQIVAAEMARQRLTILSP
ncbi:MAG: hypothetical protein KJZ98_03265 [Burkholderiaceae bacterium]|jgi:hypothetical protein|nr:hypothetical protein [Burkholderiaceae bacterium]MEB2351313.1 hypothetical protein [Burkholderiaceae bacterium]